MQPTENNQPESAETKPSAEQQNGGVTPQSNDASSEPMRFRTARYGELEEHELVRLLDTIEDERARGRFRESIYISIFVWLAIAWVIFYGPRVLWHAPKLILPSEAMKQHEMMILNAPVMPHPPTMKAIPRNELPPAKPSKLPPAAAPSTEAPKVEQPKAPAEQPAPKMTASNTPNLPDTPQPHVQPHAPQPIADAPTPQPSSRPILPRTPSNASSAMNDLEHSMPKITGTMPSNAVGGNLPGGGNMGAGAEILSDTQGVNFDKYLYRLQRDTANAWYPLLPEEVRPPLSKSGESYWLLTILPDGTIGGWKLEGSTHDQAIDRSAWGSIVTQGKLQPLPKEFHGPNLVIRLHYVVNSRR